MPLATTYIAGILYDVSGGGRHVEMPAGRKVRIKPRNFFGANRPAPTAHDVFTYVLHDYIAIMYSSE